MDPTQILLWVVALPVGVSTALGAVILLWGRGDAERGARLGWLGGVALAAAYLAGHLGVLGAPASLGVTVTTEWLPLYAALVGVPLGALEAWRFERGWRWLPRALASALLLGFMLKAKVQYTWTTGEAVRAVLLTGAACMVAWLFVDILRHSPPPPDDVEVGEGGPGAALVTLTWLGLTALTLAMGSSLKLGMLGGVLTAAFGPFLVVTWFRRDVPALRGAFPVMALVWQALVLRGVFYASTPKLAAVLLIAACFGSGISTWPLVRRRPWWQGALASTAMLSVFAASAVGLTYYETFVRAEAEAQEGPGDEDYGSMYGDFGGS